MWTDPGSPRRDIAEYKPILEEVENILREAGLDEEEMKRSAAAGGKSSVGQSRNRRYESRASGCTGWWLGHRDLQTPHVSPDNSGPPGDIECNGRPHIGGVSVKCHSTRPVVGVLVCVSTRSPCMVLSVIVCSVASLHGSRELCMTRATDESYA